MSHFHLAELFETSSSFVLSTRGSSFPVLFQRTYKINTSTRAHTRTHTRTSHTRTISHIHHTELNGTAIGFHQKNWTEDSTHVRDLVLARMSALFPKKKEGEVKKENAVEMKKESTDVKKESADVNKESNTHKESSVSDTTVAVTKEEKATKKELE